MLTLADVRDWLKSFGFAEHYYIGKLDNKKQKSIGVYQRKETGTPRITIGGLDNTRYDVKRISVLLHWNQNAKETEEAALAFWEKLREVTNVQIGETHVDYLMLLVPEPQDVGTDDNGIYERVIWFDLYYER
ncbi:hypothetical protein D1155_07910 [Anaerotruncus sp. 80]|uniref:DUF3168 domain-containing protein n=1 Tax=Anaerotruncus colihominis TaxID=169435 RepID=A0A845QHE8_9FIRM|nr:MULTISPECIES: minor capsid protein [Anaerotruncus]NBH61572.1 hypothetical protein [Anaerotruncus colihominis]NCF02227.1 hypothetical protein [Anaerotruncus sp. 80]